MRGNAVNYGFRVDQLNRAVLSIATNLAEGNGRFTRPDRRNFFTIARGSTQERVPLLEIARRRGLFKDPAAIALKERLEVIARMISDFINGLDSVTGDSLPSLSLTSKLLAPEIPDGVLDPAVPRLPTQNQKQRLTPRSLPENVSTGVQTLPYDVEPQFVVSRTVGTKISFVAGSFWVR